MHLAIDGNPARMLRKKPDFRMDSYHHETNHPVRLASVQLETAKTYRIVNWNVLVVYSKVVVSYDRSEKVSVLDWSISRTVEQREP